MCALWVFSPPISTSVCSRRRARRIGGLRFCSQRGRAAGAEMLAWGRAALGVEYAMNFMARPNANMVASSCGAAYRRGRAVLAKL